MDGCERPRACRGLCWSHYRRFQRHGDPGGAEIGNRDAAGGRLNNQGYRIIRVNQKPKPEHRQVMELALGRALRLTETVHRINGNRDDDRLENLELWLRFHPSGRRVQGAVEWAVTVLRRYRPDLLAEE